MTKKANRSASASSNNTSTIARPTSDSDRKTLERARTQWQFGDWGSLCRLDPELLKSPAARAQISLLAAAGYSQIGDQNSARKYLLLARRSGCNFKLIEQVLLSGAHNTLGRASAIAGRHTEAIEHFRKAIEISPFNGDTRLITLARVDTQYTQLGIDMPRHQVDAMLAGIGKDQAEASLFKKTATHTDAKGLVVERIAAFNLGDAWASNTVNTVIFRHHGVLTWGDFQYTAFYLDEATLRLVQRELATNVIKTHDLAGQYNLRDAHNSISLGVDREGHIHISYDHHATKLRYRRSERPENIECWTDELQMTGVNEDRVTYPTFILPRAGYPLTLLYRDGVHNKGSARIKTYCEASQTWTDRPSPILSGLEQKPWTSNAYWNHPAIGSDGSLYLSFVWRTDTIGEQQLVNNINIGYAWSPDNGLNWFTSLGQPYRLPITQVNAEVVWPVSPGSNLINQTSMALDSQNRPHIVFYSNDVRGVPQYQHLWFDGSTWHHQFVSTRTQPFTLQGGGTLQIPISRPEIIIDAHDNAYMVLRGDLTQDRMGIIPLARNAHGGAAAGVYSILQLAPAWAEPVGFSEPIIDRIRWQRDRILTMLLQFNEQPNGDGSYVHQSAPIWLVDFHII